MVATTIERVAKPRPLWSAACKGSAERAGWCGVFLVVGCGSGPRRHPDLRRSCRSPGHLVKSGKNPTKNFCA